MYILELVSLRYCCCELLPYYVVHPMRSEILLLLVSHRFGWKIKNPLHHMLLLQNLGTTRHTSVYEYLRPTTVATRRDPSSAGTRTLCHHQSTELEILRYKRSQGSHQSVNQQSIPGLTFRKRGIPHIPRSSPSHPSELWQLKTLQEQSIPCVKTWRSHPKRLPAGSGTDT